MTSCCVLELGYSSTLPETDLPKDQAHSDHEVIFCQPLQSAQLGRCELEWNELLCQGDRIHKRPLPQGDAQVQTRPILCELCRPGNSHSPDCAISTSSRYNPQELSDSL